MTLDQQKAELERVLSSLMPRMPNYRYWQNKTTGAMYCYTTETVDGGYWVMIYKPRGKGARSGKARQWHLIEKRGAYDRITARRLAYQLYKESKGEG